MLSQHAHKSQILDEVCGLVSDMIDDVTTSRLRYVGKI
jgi:hypothetical protein